MGLMMMIIKFLGSLNFTCTLYYTPLVVFFQSFVFHISFFPSIRPGLNQRPSLPLVMVKTQSFKSYQKDYSILQDSKWRLEFRTIIMKSIDYVHNSRLKGLKDSSVASRQIVVEFFNRPLKTKSLTSS